MRCWKTWVGGLVLLALTACAGTPYDYHSERETPRGPGLVSGEDGVFGDPPRRVE